MAKALTLRLNKHDSIKNIRKYPYVTTGADHIDLTLKMFYMCYK